MGLTIKTLGSEHPSMLLVFCPGILFLLQAENVNRSTEGEEARSVEQAIKMLGAGGPAEIDAHPERCEAASYFAHILSDRMCMRARVRARDIRTRGRHVNAARQASCGVDLECVWMLSACGPQHPAMQAAARPKT